MTLRMQEQVASAESEIRFPNIKASKVPLQNRNNPNSRALVEHEIFAANPILPSKQLDHEIRTNNLPVLNKTTAQIEKVLAPVFGKLSVSGSRKIWRLKEDGEEG